MKYLLFTIVALCLLSAPAAAQTLKSLMYNTNGQVVANTGTNTLTFTNSIKIGDVLHNAYGVFYDNENGAGIDVEQGQIKNYLGNIVLTWGDSDFISVQLPLLFNNTTNAATTRTNLGLPLAALTNIYNVDFVRAIGLGPVYSEQGWAELYDASTNLVLDVEDGVTIYRNLLFAGTNAALNAAITRTNLGLGATWLTNTSADNFRDAVGLGGGDNVSFNQIELFYNESQGVFWFILDGPSYYLTTDTAQTKSILTFDTTFNVGLQEQDPTGITAHVPINFSQPSVATTTRTNLGLGLPALTNTSNVTMMRALSGSTNTNHPFSGTVSVVGTNNTNTLTFSNGILQSVQ